MNPEKTRTPEYWRMRAEETRAKADRCAPIEATQMRRTAEAYDQLALSAEQFRTIQQYADDQRGHP
jgi:hypothetical protein